MIRAGLKPWGPRGQRRGRRGGRQRGAVGGGGAGRLGPRRSAGKRQQGDVARTLDGHAEPALVAGTNSSHTPRENLAALLDKLREDVRTLVVDEVHLLDAKLADLLLAEILALAARTAAGTAR